MLIRRVQTGQSLGDVDCLIMFFLSLQKLTINIPSERSELEEKVRCAVCCLSVACGVAKVSNGKSSDFHVIFS